MDNPGLAIRTAAVLLWVNGAGFGTFRVPGIIRLARDQEVPVIFGFPATGGGPFARVGLKTSIPLLVGLLAINVLLVVAGGLLWTGARTGAYLMLALLVPAGTYWWGFALPFGPVLALGTTLLLVANWSQLH